MGKINKKHKKALKRKKKMAEQKKRAMAKKNQPSPSSPPPTNRTITFASTPNDISHAHRILGLTPQQMGQEIGEDTLAFFEEAQTDGLNRDSFKAFFDKATLKGDEAIAAGRDLVGLDCGDSCSYCCYARVEALPPELFLIEQHMKDHLTEEQRTGIKDRIDTVISEGRPKDLDYWTREKVACPFLESDSCLVYESRPHLCRQQNSTSKALCETAHNDPTNDNIESWGAPKHLNAVVQGSTILALREAGLSYHPVELSSGMKILLDNPESETQWLNGEDPYHSAVTDDNPAVQMAAAFASMLDR